MRHLAIFVFLAGLAVANCLEAAGWSVFERTNIKGTVSGVVKRGTILKTTSQRIYEVTGITIQVVVEVQPKALVLANGSEYKLIIDGFDDPLICKLLTPTNLKGSPNLPAANLTESRIKGEFKGWSGETIFRLDNGQIWQQAAYAYHYHYAYRPKVTIFKSGSGHEMKVDGVSKPIAVRLISGAVAGVLPAARNVIISRIDAVRSVIELSDGSVWSVAKIHQKKAARWKKGDKLSITKYEGVMILTKTKNKQFAFVTQMNGPRKAAGNQDALVAPPNRPVVGVGGRIYPATGKGHWIKKKADGGKTIILEDGSVWEIDPFDRISAVLWLVIDDITVVESDDGTPGYDYLLINTDDKEKAHAKYLGK